MRRKLWILVSVVAAARGACPDLPKDTERERIGVTIDMMGGFNGWQAATDVFEAEVHGALVDLEQRVAADLATLEADSSMSPAERVADLKLCQYKSEVVRHELYYAVLVAASDELYDVRLFMPFAYAKEEPRITDFARRPRPAATEAVVVETALDGDALELGAEQPTPRPSTTHTPTGDDHWVTGVLSFELVGAFSSVVEQTDEYAEALARLAGDDVAASAVTLTFRKSSASGIAAVTMDYEIACDSLASAASASANLDAALGAYAHEANMVGELMAGRSERDIHAHLRERRRGQRVSLAAHDTNRWQRVMRS